MDSLETKKILGIDPGSHHLGLCLLEFTNQYTITSMVAQTINVGRVAKLYKDAFLISERFSRYVYMRHLLNKFLHEHHPDYVICESSYYNIRTPGSYEALVECVSMIRDCVYEYNPKIRTTKVKPSVAKKIVGAKGNKGKESIKSNLKNYPKLKNYSNIIDTLDEHACDATAIAVSGLRRLEMHSDIQHIEPKEVKSKKERVKNESTSIEIVCLGFDQSRKVP